MAALLNRARMTTATTGTGTVTLGSAVDGYATFAEAGAVDSTSYSYCIEDGDDFEIGTGTYTSTGTTFSRDSVTLSKISGTAGTTKLTLSGNAEIFVTIRSADVALSDEIREVLTANRTYYVRSDGSDSNDGLADSSGGAFLTIQKAIDTVYSIDISVYNVTIQVADATYTGTIRLVGAWIGSGTVTLQGNTSTPANAVISVTSNDAIMATAGARLTINGFEIRTTTSGSGVRAETAAVITLGTAVNFGACSFRQIDVRRGALVQGTSYTVSGGALSHVIVSEGGHYAVSGGTVTFSGTPAFTTATFKAEATGTMSIFSTTMSGSATGKRYDCTLGGIINTFSGGATFLPGDVAGTTATGGQYA